MNMNRLNVFRRLDELETANLHLNVMLKSTRMEVEALKSGVTILHNAMRLKPKAEAEVKIASKKRKPYTTEKIRERKREYARAYYAKKRAEKAAA
jgi:hypothetical protein